MPSPVQPTLYTYVRPADLRRSPTMSAAEMAKDAVSKGVQVDIFTVGDLFPKPLEEEVAGWVKALKDEAAKPENKGNPVYTLRTTDKWRAYGETAGLPSFRAAAAKCFSSDYGMKADAAHVIVGNGGKGALSGAFYYLANKKDAVVLMAAPGWPTNYDLFPTGCKLVEVDTNGRGIMSPEQLEGALKALGTEPDVIFINAPTNPTGANYGPEEREALMEVVSRCTKNTVLASDDPYGKLVFDRVPYNIATVLNRGKNEIALFDAGRLAVFRTASKEYGMADSRTGWVVTKNSTLLTSLQSYNESIGGGMSARNQLEVQAALMFGDGFIIRTVETLMKKRAMLIEGIGKLTYARMQDPQATIYGWVNFEGLKGAQVPADAMPDGKSFTIDTPDALNRYLVYVAGMCGVSGQAFYAPGSPAATRDWHVRMSFCNDEAELVRGLAKLVAAEGKLKLAKAA